MLVPHSAAVCTTSTMRHSHDSFTPSGFSASELESPEEGSSRRSWMDAAYSTIPTNCESGGKPGLAEIIKVSDDEVQPPDGHNLGRDDGRVEPELFAGGGTNAVATEADPTTRASSATTSASMRLMASNGQAGGSQRHLDKQNEALMETYRAMSHELHKLQVEEETIMRKLYELMSAEGLLPKVHSLPTYMDDMEDYCAGSSVQTIILELL
ncbi:hypothetical protein BAE44_0016647 [Dichanthelium oligosanthes]|uniref:Uncharacterized protein n=1 Tax=Dichanthelium oligosanthes TaxID=888268 RepID=A0A1E5VB06_9POAL|nr:hypothetical protein BAE44_0016647 [Dichanthelium oligosanthes]